MSIHIKPERIVDLLITRLGQSKIKSPLDDESNKGDYNSKLEELEREIISTRDFSTRIRSLEESLVGKFVQLYKSIESDLKNLEKMDQSEFDNKLELFSKIISEIKKLTSSIPPPADSHTAADDVLRENQKQNRSRQGRTPSEEWAQLRRRQSILVKPWAMESFQASFRSLRNFKLKLCLLCFSIFPEKCEIKKKPMIYWWMAEGLVTSDTDGDNTYRDLIKKGLIIPAKGKNSCTLKPWIRHMLISIAKESKFFCSGDQERSLFLLENAEENHTKNGFKEEDLSTVFNVNESRLSYSDEWFSKLKKVVILQLGRWQAWPKHHIEMEHDESLNGLKTQKRLKYLSLRGVSRITKLPRSITGLDSLTILDLRACHNLENLPSDISMLKNLTHLDVSECYLLESMPKGIDKLLALSVLKGFIIGNKRNPTCQVSDLTALTKLTKLSIYIRAKAIVDEKEFERLKDIKSLCILTISWGKVAKQEQESKLTSIAFPEKLQKLDLRCIPERTTPEWLHPHKFPELEKLYISGGSLTKFDIGENVNWKLKILRLRYLKSLETTEEYLKENLPGVCIDISK